MRKIREWEERTKHYSFEEFSCKGEQRIAEGGSGVKCIFLYNRKTATWFYSDWNKPTEMEKH